MQLTFVPCVSQLPPLSALERVREAWRRETAAEESAATAVLQLPAGFDVASLLFGDLMAAAVYRSEMPTALRLEVVA